MLINLLRKPIVDVLGDDKEKIISQRAFCEPLDTYATVTTTINSKALNKDVVITGNELGVYDGTAFTNRLNAILSNDAVKDELGAGTALVINQKTVTDEIAKITVVLKETFVDIKKDIADLNDDLTELEDGKAAASDLYLKTVVNKDLLIKSDVPSAFTFFSKWQVGLTNSGGNVTFNADYPVITESSDAKENTWEYTSSKPLNGLTLSLLSFLNTEGYHWVPTTPIVVPFGQTVRKLHISIPVQYKTPPVPPSIESVINYKLIPGVIDFSADFKSFTITLSPNLPDAELDATLGPRGITVIA